MISTEARLTLEMFLTFISLAYAYLGVFVQNYALRLADMGEIPDIHGAFLGGDLPFETAKQWWTDLRAHYRRSASKLSMSANLLLLVSTSSAVLTAWLTRWWIGMPLIVLLIFSFVFVISFSYKRRREIKNREQTLEARREEYNNKTWHGAVDRMGAAYANAAIKPIPPFERVKW